MSIFQSLPGIRYPLALTSLIAIAVVIILTVRASRTSARVRASLGIAAPSKQVLALIAVWCATALVALAIVRPYWGFEDLKIETRGSEVVLLVDVSRSMYADDVPPNRIELAKRKLKDIIDQFAKRGETHRFGITVFAGDAYTVCPITTDQGVIKQFIDVISPELVTGLGSNLGAGIALAVSRFDRQQPGAHRVILLTDGEHSDSDMSKALAELTDRRVRLDILGIGTPTGSTITLPNGSLLTDESRKTVVSKLDEDALKTLANATGGIYETATVDDSDLEALTSPSIQLGHSSKGAHSTIRSYREFGSWLAFAALIILLVPLLIHRRTALLTVPLILVLPLLSAYATPTADTPSSLQSTSPFTLYEHGAYKDASEAFARELTRSPNDRRLQFGLASALFKAGKSAESQKLFHELAEGTQDGRAYFESTYNEGNALLSMGRFQDAIDAYRKALDVKPDDQAAQHNLSVARALLEEERNNPKTPTPTNTPTSTATQNPEPQQSPEAAPSPTPQKHESPAPTPTASESPSTDATPNQAPSESPEPRSTSQGESGTPSPNPSQPADGDESATPDPQRTPPVTQAPGTPGAAEPTPVDRLKEAIESPSQSASANAPVGQSPTPEVETSTEASAWLESLPDSPLLIRRHRGSPSRSGQTW
jgi:Ca-activated chloride channel family protein